MRKPDVFTWLASGLLALAIGLPAAPADAKQKKKKKVDEQTQIAIGKAKGLMSTGERDSVEAGIQSLGMLGKPEAVAPLVARMREGLPPDLLEAAIVTCMALGQPEAGPVLFELTLHRRPVIRQRAVEAIAALAPPGADAALVTALSDQDANVRAAAARALGELKAQGALEPLFLALDRGNMEASGAIGKIVAPDQTGRLWAYMGKIPFNSLAPAMAEVLSRTDVTQKTKLELVARLQEVATPEVKGFLGDYMAGAQGELDPVLSKAILRAMQEIAE